MELRNATNRPAALDKVFKKMRSTLDEASAHYVMSTARKLGSCVEQIRAGREEQRRFKISLPNETILVMLSFLTRDELDAIQLVCRRYDDIVRGNETEGLPQRRIIKEAKVGHTNSGEHVNRRRHNWSPRSTVQLGDDDRPRQLSSPTELKPFLRLAYCETFELSCLDDDIARKIVEELLALVGELSLSGVSANRLIFTAMFPDHLADIVDDLRPRAVFFGKYAEYGPDKEALIRLAESGVERFELELYKSHILTDEEALVAFCFANPTADGSRYISAPFFRASCNLLQLIKEAASELDGTCRHHIAFTIDEVTCELDEEGFEKYELGDDEDWTRTWLVGDLDNGVTVEYRQPSATDRLEVVVKTKE
ncbi:hypothetical protein AAVH_25672 [Aphelenchoides avenae]|nr:hypothetical protein AAVH_25672 [Aphelenchus avenae]